MTFYGLPGGVSTRGGRGFGFKGGGPGAGFTSIGEGSGASCWVAAGAPAGGRGGSAAVDGGIGVGGSPRSSESSRRVSRSIVRTESQDDKPVTSTLRLSASGEPATNS